MASRSRPPLLASALALRWLAQTWTPRAMAAAARELLAENQRRRAASLARDALRAFPRAPHGEPSTLARWLGSRLEIRRGPAGAGPPHAVRRWPVRPARPAERSAPFGPLVPPTIGELGTLLGVDAAELDALVDVRSMGARATPRQSHYAFTWIPKRTGGARLLESPKPRLRDAQRAVLDAILSKVPPHEAAHGFVRGRSVVSFAAPHVGRALVVRIDLEDFFGQVHAGRAQGIFRHIGASDTVARALAGLCTARTPSRVLRRRPTSPDEPMERAERARMRLRGPHLPQGAPTSPALANLAAFRLDLRLAGLAARLGARYTRYADDLAFSFDDARRPRDRFVAMVSHIAREEGFDVAAHKTRWMRAHQRQVLGGLVVNASLRVPRAEVDRMRAVLHRAAIDGLDALMIDVVASRRLAHLRGRIEWCRTGSPSRRARRLSLPQASGDG